MGSQGPDRTQRLSPPLLPSPRGGTSGKEAASQCSRGGRGRLHPGVGKILEAGRSNRSSVLAWKIPRSEEPGGLQSIGLQRIGRK